MFIVDRSGSMSGQRIAITKEAMKLFIKSLPPDCHFQVVSFGDYYNCMVLKEKEYVHAYNENKVEEALQQINRIDADMGGTEIFAPL